MTQPGSLLTDDWQAEIRGAGAPLLLAGIYTVDIPTWSRPDPRTQRTVVSGRIGARPDGPDIADVRDLDLDIVISASQQPAIVAAALDDLRTAWKAMAEGVGTIAWTRAGVTRFVYGRPGRIAADETSLRFGLVRVRARWDALDPREYGATLRVAALPAEDASGGLAWPAVWPAQWGASETGIVEADNAGGDDAPLVWTIVGPKTNPTLIDVDRGVQLQLAGTVPDGSVVVVDTGARTVELDGVDRWSWVTGDSGWPTVEPGGGRLRETSTAGTGASSIAWRDTWT